MNNLDELAYKIENIVRKCGQIMLNVEDNSIEITNKEGIGNIVTQYDKKIQDVIKKELLELLPESIFIGEEEDLHLNISDNNYTFIVDPIDGTTNFSRGLKSSAISVALLKDKKQYIAVCYNPYLDEMFVAQKDKGAYLNNKKIHVSNKLLKEGLFYAGNSPYYEELREKTYDMIKQFNSIAHDYRISGSAVIELCNIACGRAELYCELRLQPWDCAAGSLIISEAGGKVTTIDNKEITFDNYTSILASNNMEDYYKYIKNN